MPTTTNDQIQAPATANPAKKPKYQTPAGHRVIHVIVPEATFVHVHKMALESGLRFSHYLNRFLTEAFPYRPESAREDASQPRT